MELVCRLCRLFQLSLATVLLAATFEFEVNASIDVARSDNVPPWAARSRPPNAHCQDKCHVNHHVPCSCSGYCVLFNNCCPDIEEHCPGATASGQQELAALTTVDVHCDSYGLFFISSCPQAPVSESDNLTRKQWTTDDMPAPLRQAILAASTTSTTSGTVDLNEILANTPITDTAHGLTYSNFSVFSCGALPGARPSLWRPTVSLSHEQVNDDGFLKDTSHLPHHWYLPPTDVDPSRDAKFPCISVSKATCSLNTDPELKKECENGSINYVVRIKQPFEYYNNIHCAECNSVKTTVSATTNKFGSRNRHFYNLNVAFSFLPEKMSIVPQKTLVSNPWAEAECRMSKSEEAHLSGGIECEVTKCEVGFTRLYDGTCGFKISLRLMYSFEGLDAVLFDHITWVSDIIPCMLESKGFMKPSVEFVDTVNVSGLQGTFLFIVLKGYYREALIDNLSYPTSFAVDLNALGKILYFGIRSLEACGFQYQNTGTVPRGTVQVVPIQGEHSRAMTRELEPISFNASIHKDSTLINCKDNFNMFGDRAHTNDSFSTVPAEDGKLLTCMCTQEVDLLMFEGTCLQGCWETSLLGDPEWLRNATKGRCFTTGQASSAQPITKLASSVTTFILGIVIVVHLDSCPV